MLQYVSPSYIRWAIYLCYLAEQKAELEEATTQLKGMIEDTKENIATEVLEKVQSAGMYSLSPFKGLELMQSRPHFC